MKTPDFWLKKSLISNILMPFSWLYQFIFALNVKFSKAKKYKTPIICIGNLTAGGSGKTPTALALGKILAKNNIKFAFLSRGYKGKKQEAIKVNNQMDWREIGDELLLLSEEFDAFMAKNRSHGLELIDKGEYQLSILDDGMQNYSIKKDLSFLVVDSKIKFGNKMLLPAGPLREKIDSGLKKSDLIIVIGGIDDELKEILAQKISKNEVIEAKIVAKNLDNFQNKELLAFCGLAYPEKFFSFLTKSGLNVVDKIAFADHYSYKKTDLENLIRKSQNNKQKLITTKKDWVKFDDDIKKQIEYLDIELEFDNVELIFDRIKLILKN